MMMRTLQFFDRNQVRIVETSIPTPGPGEVIIKTAVSAICGSEMGAFRAGRGEAPGNPGHEAAGTVYAIAPDVTTLAVGQRVGLSAIAGCGQCEFCKQGIYTWCPGMKFYDSMHSEYIRVAANACHVFPDDIDWETGVLIAGDGLGVAWHSSTKIADSKAQTVAIFGAGPIGLGNAFLQHHFGRRIIITDISETRLDMARSLGADFTFNPTTSDTVDEIRKSTGGKGADVCIEAAGRPETAMMCFNAVKTGGQVIFNGEQNAIPVSVSRDFIRRDITATGSWFYHFHEYNDMLRQVRQGFPVRRLVSHVFPFTSAQEAYDLFAAGKTAKVLLSYR